MHYTHQFPGGRTEYFLNSNYSQLLQLAPVSKVVIITDEQVHRQYGHLFSEYRVLIVPAGEEAKDLQTIAQLTAKLASFEAHKHTCLIGIGGGMITDITGFLAGIYMRGIAFGFVPTTLLGMVDAAIGGKNGVNVGLYKNMLGLIRQPSFILFDNSFLDSLPQEEWSNGFAEVIKYACIRDRELLEELFQKSLARYRSVPSELNELIVRCVAHKNEVVLQDEQERHLRKTLNFGHTAGHAFETIYHLKHGYAVGLGMIVALIASEKHLALDPEVRIRLVQMLHRYGLPAKLHIDVDKVMTVLRRDKKRQNDHIDFILLREAGSAEVTALSFDFIRECLKVFASDYGN
ncbi:MAG: 3-dehydroquinate synthase [Chitinophagaceae bacterium]